MCLHSNSDASSSASLHMDFHNLKRLKMMWSYIKKFHAGWESLKYIQFGMGIDQFSMWWCDFHILIFIFYDDKILLLLLIFGRGEIIPWDPGIVWNDIFPKEEETFGSLQRRQWDPSILLSYLNQVENFVERSGHWRNDYNQSGAIEAWRKKFVALWSASA